MFIHYFRNTGDGRSGSFPIDPATPEVISGEPTIPPEAISGGPTIPPEVTETQTSGISCSATFQIAHFSAPKQSVTGLICYS